MAFFDNKKNEKRLNDVDVGKVIQAHLKPDEIILWQSQPVDACHLVRKRLFATPFVIMCAVFIPLGILALNRLVADIIYIFTPSGSVTLYYLPAVIGPGAANTSYNLDLSTTFADIALSTDAGVALLISFATLGSIVMHIKNPSRCMLSLYVITNMRTLHFNIDKLCKEYDRLRPHNICALDTITKIISRPESKDGLGSLKFWSTEIVAKKERKSFHIFQHIPNVREVEERLRKAISGYKWVKQG